MRPAYPTKRNQQIAARKSLEKHGLNRDELNRIIHTLEQLAESEFDPLLHAAKEMLMEMPQQDAA